MNHLNCVIKVSMFPEIIKYINMLVTAMNIKRVITIYVFLIFFICMIDI